MPDAASASRTATSGAPVAASTATARTDDATPGAGGSNSTDATAVRSAAGAAPCRPTASTRAAREPGGGPYATYERLPSSETAIACPLHAAASPYDPSMPYRHGPASAAPDMHACRCGAAWAAETGAAAVAFIWFPAMSRTAPAASETVHSGAGARPAPPPLPSPPAAAAAASAAPRSDSACPAVRPITSTSESACEATRAPPRPTVTGAMPDAGRPACVTLTSSVRADVRLAASSRYSASVPARRFSRGGTERSRAGPDASSTMSGLSVERSVPTQ